MASAVLLAGAPDRMAVYDSRALHALGMLGIPVGRRFTYHDYMMVVEDLRAEVAAEAGAVWRARDVDTALFTLGWRPRQSTVRTNAPANG